MATISKTGIADGLTSKAEHLTRIIDALDGTATTEVVATGSFTGSFVGVYTGTVVSSSYAVTASYAENVSPGFPFAGAAIISGSLFVSQSGANAGIDFSDAGAIIVPSTETVNAIRNLTQVYTGGSHILIDISGTGESHVVALPAASNNYLGQEWTFDFKGVGGNSKFQISGSENKIFGTVIHTPIDARINSISGSGASAGSGANFFQVDGSTARLTDTYTLRSLGSTGWKLVGRCDNGSSFSSSFLGG